MHTHHTTTGLRHYAWLAVLVAASVAFSSVFACATPFAAFGVLAALTLDRRDALLLTLGVWLANQFTGFAFLHYPGTAESIGWGLAIGITVMLTTLTARFVMLRLRSSQPLALVMAAMFLAAFAVYQGVLFLFALTPLGGSENFTADIVGRIFATDGLAFIGLFALNQLAAKAGFSAAVSPKHA